MLVTRAPWFASALIAALAAGAAPASAPAPIPPATDDGRLIVIAEPIDAFGFDPCSGDDDSDGMDCISLDFNYNANFRVLEVLHGRHPDANVVFTVSDHYRVPRMLERPASLLFLRRTDSGWLYSEKYRDIELHRTTDGDWASCGPRKGAEGKRLPSAKTIPFANAVVVDTDPVPPYLWRRYFTSPWYRIDGERVTCHRGYRVADLLKIEAPDLVLRPRVLAGPRPYSRLRRIDADLTEAPEEELIELRVTGPSLDVPFTWTVTVTRGERVLHRESGTDDRFDQAFGTAGFIDGCEGYERCKLKWYGPEIWEKLKREHGRTDPAPLPLDPDRVDMLRSTATAWFEENGIDAARRPAILAEMEGLLASGYGFITEAPSPVQQGATLMWVPSLQRFVPCYDD